MAFIWQVAFTPYLKHTCTCFFSSSLKCVCWQLIHLYDVSAQASPPLSGSDLTGLIATPTLALMIASQNGVD